MGRLSFYAVIIITLFIGSISILGCADETNQTGALSTEQLQERLSLCSTLTENAVAIHEARQMGVSLSDVMDAFETMPEAEDMTEVAVDASILEAIQHIYSQPMYQTDELIQQQRANLELEIQTSCLNALF